jgi:hypothetical protein
MTTDRPFRVNTKKARSAAAKAECAEELGALFSCMMVRGREREKKEEEISMLLLLRPSNILDLCSLTVLFPLFLFSSSPTLSEFASRRATSMTLMLRARATGGRWTRASRRR